MTSQASQTTTQPSSKQMVDWFRMAKVLVLLILSMAAGVLMIGSLEPEPQRRPNSVAHCHATLARLLAADEGIRPRRWQYIVIHHSAMPTGSEATINRYHSDERRLGGTGYHFVIGNGTGSDDGCIEPTRRWRQQLPGAHCTVQEHPEYNSVGIGICLIGNFESDQPTDAQMEALIKLTATLRKKYDIPIENILAHKDVKNTICPGRYFNFPKFIDMLRRQALHLPPE